MKYTSYLLFLALLACAPLRTVPYEPAPAPVTYEQQPAPRTAKAKPKRVGRCGEWSDYLPEPGRRDHLPERYIRVNFHVMNSRDSTRNFRPDQARAYLTRLLELANMELDTNERNWRSPEGTAVLEKRFRYVLTPQPGDDGFYFHYDDSSYLYISRGKYQNNYQRGIIKKYGVGTDSIVNVFVQVHPPDSMGSRTYKTGVEGIALGTSIKIAGMFENNTRPEHACGNLNHEFGHVLGLIHAWGSDGCDDTDTHANRCWSWTENGPCRDQASNNMMDYNAYQRALTPCQIGTVHANFASERHAIRPCLVPTWCTPQPGGDVVIRDSVAWNGARDLEGNLTVADGGILHLSNCRVSLPEGSRITVAPGGRLYLDGTRLHNACGRPWDGIFIQSKGDRRGEVVELAPATVER